MPTRRLAAIMFADIVGYTAMMQRDESSGMAKAHRFSEVMKAQVHHHHGEVLEFRGDGSLCIFNSAVEAVKCAKAIQQRLKGDVPLRIGIHIGDIVLKNGHIYGDGVNLASRVESMGVPGSVLVTERVIHDVKSHPELEMTSLGKFQFKNVANPMEVFALANEGFAIPKATEMKGKGKKYRPIYKQLAYAMLGIMILVGGGYEIQQYQQASALQKLEKSLVVLPFINKSEEADTDYFSDGITEDILIQLSKLQGLKVISQSSAMRFKDSDESLQEIADQLGVNFVVEGSVRKQGDQIRISAQLIYAPEDANLWAEQYNFELKDVFAIQSEVAKSIATQLKSKISPEEQKRLNEQPTDNSEAYQLYLRGRQVVQDRSLQSLQSAEALFHEAIELDPEFAHAKAELANIIYLLRNYRFVPDSLRYYDKAFDLSMEVLQVNSNIARAYEVLGSVSRQRREFSKAIGYFRSALEIDPQDEATLQRIAIQLHILGKKEAAIYTIRKALEYNPFSPILKGVYIRILAQNRMYDLAKEQFNIALKLFPKNQTIIWHGKMIYATQGKCDELIDYYNKWQLQGNASQANSSIFSLFNCYCAQENVEQAMKFFEKVNMYPDRDLLLARANRNVDKMFNILWENLPSTHPYFLVDPAFDILRDDPRYEEYLRQSPFGQVSDEDVEALMELVE